MTFFSTPHHSSESNSHVPENIQGSSAQVSAACLSETREAGGSIKPGVERSGTPGGR